MVYCPKCGNNNPESSIYFYKCGHTFSTETEEFRGVLGQVEDQSQDYKQWTSVSSYSGALVGFAIVLTIVMIITGGSSSYLFAIVVVGDIFLIVVYQITLSQKNKARRRLEQGR